MSKTKTTNLIVIDASGSMQNKKDEVVGGLKQLFSDIKRDAQRDVEKVQTTTIVVDFSSPEDINVLAYEKDSTGLDETLAEGYKVRSWTALFDAIDFGFGLIPKGQDSVFVNILTDGEENSSKKATLITVKDLFAKAERNNWAVTFMGTTKEAIEKAKGLGISAGNTFAYMDNSEGLKMSMNKLKGARTAFYAAASTNTLDKTTLDNLMKDESKD